MKADLYDLFEEARTPTDFDRTFERTRLSFEQPRLSEDGTRVRNDIAMERAVRKFRALHAGRRVRVEYKPQDPPQPLVYRADGVLLPDDARTVQFVGTNGCKSIDLLLVRDESRVEAVPINLIVNVEFA